jgi:hypothetical protein
VESLKERQSLLWRNKNNRNRAGTPDGVPALLFVDGDLQTGLELDHGSILVDNDLPDELSHHALVELGDVGLLIF